jgi:hypothetical protein
MPWFMLQGYAITLAPVSCCVAGRQTAETEHTMSLQQEPTYSAAPVGESPTGVTPVQAQPAKTSGLAITGLIFAFLAPPIGFILSLIAVFKTGPGKKRGKGLAIAGILISLIAGAGYTYATVKAVSAVSTLADPGCITGKAAITDNEDKISNPATMEAALQSTIDGLKSGAAKAKHDDVRTAMQNLADDYTQLQKALKSGTAPAAGLEDKLTKDGEQIDHLCTLGAK